MATANPNQPELSTVEPADTLSRVNIPRQYNAATDFIDRHLHDDSRASKIAIIDRSGRYSYADLAERVNRAGHVFKSLGVQQEQRVLLCMHDTIDLPAAFWGAVKIGAVPIPVNTLLAEQDYAFMLQDSRAPLAVVSGALLDKFPDHIESQPYLKTVLVSDQQAGGTHRQFSELLAQAPAQLQAAATTCDDIGFWLYTSGSTGRPKGVVHLHRNLAHTAELYALGLLDMCADDVVFSAAKLFFAYGLGNSMSFPFFTGASSILLQGRPTAAAVMEIINHHNPSIFFGVPTLFGAILADKDLTYTPDQPRLRFCVSAGEALPEEIGVQWKKRFGVDIIDGLGSTEMLHIFLSNQPGQVRYGTTGRAVPGYQLKVLGEDDRPVEQGQVGDLWVKGPSCADRYWNQRDKSQQTFHGAWVRTGDKYSVDDAGYYTYASRSDDMLKVGGIYVSPFEVESALIAHQQVLEAAVVGYADDRELVKPKAFVVLKEGCQPSDRLGEELQSFVKDRLAPYKYPRWIEFRESLPKTATGKIQRFKLRQL